MIRRLQHWYLDRFHHLADTHAFDDYRRNKCRCSEFYPCFLRRSWSHGGGAE